MKKLSNLLSGVFICDVIKTKYVCIRYSEKHTMQDKSIKNITWNKRSIEDSFSISSYVLFRLDFSVCFDTVDHSIILHRLLLGLGLMTQWYLVAYHIYHLEATSSPPTPLLLLNLIFVKGSSKISSRSSLIHSLHYFSYLWFICRSSSICCMTLNFSSLLSLNYPPTVCTCKPQY